VTEGSAAGCSEFEDSLPLQDQPRPCGAWGSASESPVAKTDFGARHRPEPLVDYTLYLRTKTKLYAFRKAQP